MRSDAALLRLDILRFPLVVGVVFIHAYSTTVGFAGEAIGSNNGTLITDFIRNVISKGIARTAVPIFFLMSGFLYFYKHEFTVNSYLLKLKNRFITLFVPFLFWNILTLLVIYLAQIIPHTAIFFSGNNLSIASYTAGDFFAAILGIGRMPISYQLWFIRDLIVLIVITPVIYIGLRLFPTTMIAALSVFWIIGWWPTDIPSIEALLFFSVGCALSIHGVWIFALDIHGKAICCAYAVLAILDAMMAQRGAWGYLHNVSVVFGVMALLYASGFMVKIDRIKNRLLVLSSASFFVYASHEPVLTILRKLVYKVLHPESPYYALLLYFAVPIILISSLVFVYGVIKSKFPYVLSVVSGGRK